MHAILPRIRPASALPMACLPRITVFFPLSFRVTPLWALNKERRLSLVGSASSSEQSNNRLISQEYRIETLLRCAKKKSNLGFHGCWLLDWLRFHLYRRFLFLPKSILSNLMQEIEPLDVSVIQKDVSADTIDAMKRTISGMLGLLPSDQFHVFIEAFWESLSRLLFSSMMTGYTLRNAEYGLCLQRNLDMSEDSTLQQQEDVITDYHQSLPDGNFKVFEFPGGNRLGKYEEPEKGSALDKLRDLGLGEMDPEIEEYILHLKSRLSSAKHELNDIKRKKADVQMQQFVGEEENSLLDYLRSLEPEKVAELSQPTSLELQETIHSGIHGLLATLSPKMQTKAPKQPGNSLPITVVAKSEDDAEMVENASLHFQPLISVSRDYLARLLFWCMLLGHHLRGLEYRLELMELLSLSEETDSNDPSCLSEDDHLTNLSIQ